MSKPTSEMSNLELLFRISLGFIPLILVILFAAFADRLF